MAKPLLPLKPLVIPHRVKDGYKNGKGKLLSKVDFIDALNLALLHYHKHSDSTLANSLINQNSHLFFGSTRVQLELINWFCQYAPLRWDTKGGKLVKDKSPNARPLLTKDEAAGNELLREAKNNPPSLINTSLDSKSPGFVDLKGKTISRNDFVENLNRALRHFHENGDSTWASKIVTLNSTNPRSTLQASLVNWFLAFSPMRWDKKNKVLKKDRDSDLPLFQNNAQAAEPLLANALKYPFDDARFKKQREQSSLDVKFFNKVKKILREYELDKKEDRIPSKIKVPTLDIISKVRSLKREAEAALDELKPDKVETAFENFYRTLIEYQGDIQELRDSTVTIMVDSEVDEVFANLLEGQITNHQAKSLITFFTNAKVRNLVKKCRDKIDDENDPQTIELLKRFLLFIKPQLMLRGTDAFQEIGHDDWFKWPSTEVYADLKSRSSAYESLNQEGFLKFIGYEVGKTRGKSEGERHDLLQTAFELHIPSGETKWQDWGPRASASRLQRMAYSIAYFVRNEKKNPQGDYSQAIEEHLRDLDFLYEEYYVGHFNFDYPIVS